MGAHRNDNSLQVAIKDLASVSKQGIHEKPTAVELEDRLMGYADRYLAKVAEATDNYQRHVKTPAARELGLSTFIFPGLAVIGIAAGGEPASDLLDMIVLTTLQREALDSGWAHEILGEHAKGLLIIQRQLEEQIWTIAADVLSPPQLESVRHVINQWRKKNPNQRYVSNVRFDDVAVVRGHQQSEMNLPKSDGLLAPIDQAVKESSEIRLMARRGMYLMQRMPPLLMAQARFMVHEELSPEEIDTLLKDISGFRQSIDSAQKNLAALPGQVHDERVALFKDLEKTNPLLDKGKGMTNDIRSAVASLDQIVSQYPQSGAVLNETLRLYKDLAMHMDSQPAGDLAPKIQLLNTLNSLVHEINALAGTANGIENKKLTEISHALFASFLDALLLRGILLLLAGYTLHLGHRWLSARLFSGQEKLR